MREIGNIYKFNDIEYELVEDNIVKESKKKSFMIWLNIAGLIMTAFLVVIHLILFPIEINIEIDNVLLVWFLAILAFLVYIVIHELLHGFAFLVFGKIGKGNLKFGMVLKSGAAYCISKIPVKVNASRISLMMPVYVVCIPLYIVSILIDSSWLGIYALFLFSGSIGDLYYMFKLRKTSKDLYMYEEMPTKTGYEMGYLLFKKL